MEDIADASLPRASAHSLKMLEFVNICCGLFLVLLVMSSGVLILVLTPPTTSKLICQTAFRAENFNAINADTFPRSLAVADFNHDQIIDVIVAYSNTDQIGLFFGLENGKFLDPVIYSTGDSSEPYSIAVADLNNDTHPDVVVANHRSHTIKIFFADHLGHLNRSIEYSTNASRPFQVVLNDLNNDRYIDIAVLNEGTSLILLFINMGNESFQLSPETYFTGDDSIPSHLVLADLNHDGLIDMIVANSGTHEISIFLNSLDGHFFDPIFYSTGIGSTPSHVAVGDLNEDGQLDLTIAQPGFRQIGIFYGNGNGSFVKQQRRISTNQSIPSWIAVGDMNNDGYLDLTFIDQTQNTIKMLLRQDDGDYLDGESYVLIPRSRPTSLLLEDLNHDGRLDFIFCMTFVNHFMIFHGTNAVKFRPPLSLTIDQTYSPYGIRWIDFNNDHHQDLVVLTKNETLFVFHGNQNGTFASPVNYSIHASPSFLNKFVVQDINGDHRLDLILSEIYIRGIQIFLQDSNGTFDTMSIFRPNNIVFQGSHRFFFIDINHDPFIDLVMFDRTSNAIGVSLATGHGVFPNKFILSSTTSGNILNILLTDINRDGQIDILLSNLYVGIQILLGDGAGHFSNETIYKSDIAYGLVYLAVADLNNDNHLDIIALYSFSSMIEIWGGQQNATFQNQRLYQLSSIGFLSVMTLADFNGDSYMDIMVAEDRADRFLVLRGLGNGLFDDGIIISTSNIFNGIVAGDINNDNRSDFAITTDGTALVKIFFSYDSGSMIEKSFISTGSSSHPKNILTGDLNHDGKSDLVILNTGTHSLSFRFGLDNHKFTSETFFQFEKGSEPQAMVMGDFNHDHNLDLVVVHIGTGQLQVLLGSENGTFVTESIYSLGSNTHPFSLMSADFDQDNWLDVATYSPITNLITIFYGYRYSTFSKHRQYKTDGKYQPATVAVGDFNHDGHTDILAVNVASGVIDVYFGDGSGEMIYQMSFPSDGSVLVYALVVADFNHNDQLDLVLVTEATPYIRLFLDFDLTNPNEALEIHLDSEDSNQYRPFVVDVNDDQNLDLIIATVSTNYMHIFFGLGNGTFASPSKHTFPDNYQSSWLVTGRFNNDSYVDLVLQDSINKTLSVFIGYGNGSFWLSSSYQINDTAEGLVTVGDLNEDGYSDVIFTNRIYSVVLIYFGTNQGSLLFSTFYSHALIHNVFLLVVRTDDFNQDGHLDLVITAAARGESYIVIAHGDGQGHFYREISYSLFQVSYIERLIIADINNDSLVDVIGMMSSSFSFIIIISTCCTSLGNPRYISNARSEYDVILSAGDFNGDNRTDILVPNPNTASIVIYLNSAMNPFSSQLILRIDSTSTLKFVVSSDINNDQHQDLLVVLDGSENLMIFIGEGNGSFIKAQTYSMGWNAQLQQLYVSDLNNDTYPDVAWTDAGNNNIGVMYGYGNGSFDSIITFPTGYDSQPYDLNSVTFDDDGQVNLVAVLIQGNTFGFVSESCDRST